MAHYAERFEAAVHFLVSDGPVKQRLTQAYSEHLESLEDHELPVSVRNAVSDLHEALHRVAPMGKETRVKASVQKMSAAEATQHAEAIVRIYSAILTQVDRPEPLKVVESDSRATSDESFAPPRYLVGAT